MKQLDEMNWFKIGGIVFVMGVASIGLFVSFAYLRNELFREVGEDTPYMGIGGKKGKR